MAWPSFGSGKYFRLSCICFFLTTIALPAQQSKIDSLEKLLVEHITIDTTRANILNELAFSYFSSDVQKSIDYLEKADSLSRITNYTKGRARSIYIRGITEAIQSSFDQALEYYNEALQLYKIIDFKKGIANCFNAMGITYKNKGLLKKSITFFKKAIAIEKEIGSDNLSASYINIGTAYSDLGEFQKALLFLKKAKTIAETIGNEQRVAYSLNNLATIYIDQGNYPLALESLNKSLNIDEKLGDSIGIANHLSNIGEIYMEQEKLDQAMHFFTKSLQMHQRINRKHGASSVLNHIGILFMEQKNYNDALVHFFDALHLEEDIGTTYNVPYILNNLGTVYLQINKRDLALQYFEKAKIIGLEIENKVVLCDSYIGLAKTYNYQHQYVAARIHAQRAKQISESIGYFDAQKEASEILFKIYEATGNYKKALESHQQFKKLNDSLFNKENVEKIAQLEYEYKYKQALDSASIRELKLNKTILSTSQDLAKTKQNYLWAVIGILGTSIFSGSFVFYQKYKSVKIRNQNIVTEQKLLRSQMTPHFIFNSLSVLQGMILNKEEQKSITYLSKFSKLLRIVLENSRDKVVPLIQELDAIDNYMMLQNLDADPPYDYSLIVDENIDINLFLVPPMLIQPFIENAIEHAFTTDQENREIGVHLTLEGKKLRCTITDNGIGIDAISNKTDTKKKSLATTITKERLEMLAKDFKTAGGITIADRKKDKERGTQVTLLVPYKLDSNV